MRGRRTGEEGLAVLTVMVLMGVMLTTAFALVSTVDTQTSASRAERVRDSAFNLAESALNAQIFALSHDWPGLGRAALPYGTCTPASTSSRCPDNASLTGGASADLIGATWETRVRDNGAGSAPNFYSDASTALQPGYDANADGQVWVRAQAAAQGHTRTLVALVRVQKQEEDVLHGALIAGSVDITNNGNKELIRASGGPVSVRCPTPLTLLTYPGTCLGHALTGTTGTLTSLMSLLSVQITGTVPTLNYLGGDAVKVEARARLKATAIADGTYFTTCPTAAQMTAPIVYVEGAVSCFYNSNSQFNTPAAPGLLLLDQANVTFGGTSLFYGVIYGANTPAGAAVLTTQGNSALINGGVIIDGTAKMVVGSSGLNINFDVNAYRSVASYGSAGVVQNTWREIKGD